MYPHATAVHGVETRAEIGAILVLTEMQNLINKNRKRMKTKEMEKNDGGSSAVEHKKRDCEQRQTLIQSVSVKKSFSSLCARPLRSLKDEKR